VIESSKPPPPPPQSSSWFCGWGLIMVYNKGCVTHYIALPFTLKKKYLKAKARIMKKSNNFTMQKYINLQKNKNPLK
jgi:hypothetical protein